MKEWEERLNRIEAMIEENNKWLVNYKEENRLLTEKNEKWLDDYKKKNDKAIDEMRMNISGISDSNGMYAEEYFYRTLLDSMTFGRHHFDFVDRNRARKCKDKDGKPVETEYDVLMTNAVAVCIVEVKYRARKDHVELLLKKVAKFRIQFPEYANHKVFLGIGAMSFEEGVEIDAKKYGIGIMRQNGDAVEIDDANLKAY
jgi:hypothetical protein